MNKSERATAKQLDNQWEDVKKRHESTSLGRISQKLVSIYEVGRLWLSLKSGESLVLNYEGGIYQGRVKVENLRKLQECYTADRQGHHFAESDPKTAAAILPLKFSANNNWDTTSRLADGTRIHRSGKSEPKLDADIV